MQVLLLQVMRNALWTAAQKRKPGDDNKTSENVDNGSTRYEVTDRKFPLTILLMLPYSYRKEMYTYRNCNLLQRPSWKLWLGRYSTFSLWYNFDSTLLGFDSISNFHVDPINSSFIFVMILTGSKKILQRHDFWRYFNVNQTGDEYFWLLKSWQFWVPRIQKHLE